MSEENKTLSRREFIKLVGAGAAVASASAFLEACAGAAPTAAPPTAAPAPTTAVPATSVPATVAPQGKTLTISIQQFAQDALKPVVSAWEQKTGNKVAFQNGPASGGDVITQYAPMFQSGTSAVDVISLDDVSGPYFARAGWVVPLDDVIPQATWSDFPTTMLPPVAQDGFHSYDGHRVRIPHGFDIGYFWYRKDWFDQKNVKVPTTWDEFAQVGKEFTSAPVWGTTEGMKIPGLTLVYLAYLTAQAGGEIFKFDDGTAKAFQFAYDLIYTHKIMDVAVLNNDYTQQNDLYMKDLVAMMRQWTYFWSVARGNKAWYKEGRADIALPPAGPAGPKSWWGGWGLSIPKFSANLDAAKDLIAWLTNNQNAPVLAKGQSWFTMPRKSILDALGDTDIVPYMKMYASNPNVLVPRPYHPKQSDAETVVDQVGQAFLTKQLSLSDAMKTGQQRIAALG
jgi:trehalose/maltose transport system substrate-binding protein